MTKLKLGIPIHVRAPASSVHFEPLHKVVPSDYPLLPIAYKFTQEDPVKVNILSCTVEVAE
jgi:hypothetical protein